jgi:hypothetical protein
VQPDYSLRHHGSRSLLPAVVFLTVAIGLLAADAVNGSTVQDIDDIARRMQITDLLRDNDWHDVSWPFLAMPEPYVSPWSRIVDLPYVLVTWLFQPVLGQDSAFALARFVVPLLWLVTYAWLAAQLLREILAGRPSLVQTGAAALASLFAIIEFMPNRIDHHNVQIVLLLAVCLGVVSSHKFSGVLLGLAVFLSVAVGLECAPYIALAVTGVAVHAALAPRSGMTRKLTQTGLVLLVTTLPFGVMLSGSGLFQTHCDALSAPWASALMAGGLIAAGAPIIWKLAGLNSTASRLALLVGCGIIMLAALWFAFPACHSGPYSMINETARTFWLSNVIQEKGPAGAFARGENLLVFIFLLLLALTLAAWSCPKAYRSPVLIVLLIATLGTLLSAWQMRNFKFPAALLPLFIPLFIQRVQDTKSLRRMLISLLAPVLLLGVFAMFVKPEGRSLTLIDYMEGDSCKNADLSAFAGIPPSRVMAPFGLSLTLSQHFNETGSGHTVAAIPFHRASPGMERMFQTFVLTDTQARRTALAPFDYIAVCTIPVTDADPQLAPLYAALSSGKDWPGLKDMQRDRTSRFRLLMIDHDTVE